MYTIEAIPVTKSIGARTYTYFSALPYPVGALIVVPMQNKEVRAVVCTITETSKTKSTLRSASFALRKIRRQTPLTLLTPAFVQAILRTADQHATHPATVLTAHFPIILQESHESALLPIEEKKPNLRGYVVPRIFQGLYAHRCEFYRSTIREAFASNGSVLLLAPTIVEAEALHTSLHTGIERYTYLLHNSIRKTALRARLTDLLQNTHPIVIIATPSFLSIPRPDISTIIVEHESSPAYRSRERSKIDSRILAYELAKARFGQLFLADLPVRIESIYRKNMGEYEEIVSGHHRFRFESTATILSQAGESRPAKGRFKAVSDTLRKQIAQTVRAGGHAFLFTTRRGLSPITLCGDCGTTVTCHECRSSVVLHTSTTENYFLCHSCGSLRSARERCHNCNSWRLETFGIGTELVAQEVRIGLPNTPLFVVSSDTTKSHRAVVDTVESFFSTHGSVLIGTELSLPYIRESIPFVSIISLDSLLALPSWNIYERITSILTRLREITSQELFIQTRHPAQGIFSYALSGNFSGFYRDELLARKTMGYPPYTILVKIETTGPAEVVHERIHTLETTFSAYNCSIYPHPISAPQNKITMHCFLRIKRNLWPDGALLDLLRTLPPTYTITINPDNVM